MTTDKSKAGFNARIYTSRRMDELKAEMTMLGAEWAGVVKMATKAVHYVIKVQNLRTPAVLILKEEMLSKGGDCAIHREAITNRVERSSCLLMGTDKVFRAMLADLRTQPFELPRLAGEIQSAIEDYNRSVPVTPQEDTLSAPLREFYSAMRQRTLVMGILNVTPDSFSDGGMYANVDAAVEHGLRMVADGADVIDIGGESSRPGSEVVGSEAEIARVVPVIRALEKQINVPISIDTYRPDAARAALDAGASIINDITGLIHPDMRALAAERSAPSIIMHMKGTPQTMQTSPDYDDLISDIMSFLRERIGAAVEAGLPREYIIIDPGVGFGKTEQHNLEIIRKLGDFKSIGCPILMGTSRKGFIGRITGVSTAADRVGGTAATVAISIANGANIVRVHDVTEMVRVARMSDAVVRA